MDNQRNRHIVKLDLSDDSVTGKVIENICRKCPVTVWYRYTAK